MKDQIKIEKGIPLGQHFYRSRRVDWAQVIEDMDIGDSVLLVTWESAVSLSNRMRTHGFYAKMQKVKNEGYRVWKLNKKDKEKYSSKRVVYRAKEKSPIKIEKNIPPPNGYGFVRKLAEEMKIGDSVVVDCDKLASLRSALSHIEGIRTASKKIDEHKYRIWKLKDYET